MIPEEMPPVTESNGLAQLIKLARGDQPMRELARRSGLSAAQVSRIEAGHVDSPTIETLTRLADALDRDPQLLLAALGRIDDDEAVGLIVQALAQLGSSAPEGLNLARKRIEQLDQSVRELDKRRLSLVNEWQVLAGQHDVLKAESVELEDEIASLQSDEELNDDPDAIASLRENAEECDERLRIVLRDLDAIDRRGADLRGQMTKCEASMAQVLEPRSKLVRQTAGDLFVSGATSADRTVKALLENAIGLPPGSGVSQLIATYWNASADDDLKRALAEVTEKSTEIEMTTEQVRAQVMEMLEKSFAQTQAEVRAELQQLTRHLRNQLVHQTGDPDFRRLAAAWNRLTSERRKKVLDFAEDQRRLSIDEREVRRILSAETDEEALSIGKEAAEFYEEIAGRESGAEEVIHREVLTPDEK
jgi:transcriptional regulator with XRE-family HTH domain